MSDDLGFLVILGGWIVLQYFVLPKLGVPT